MVSTVTPEKTVDVRSFRRRYFGFGRVLLVVVVLLQIPAWIFIYHRSQPLPVTQPGTNKQYALSQTNEGWYTEPPGEPFPISHTASLVRQYVPTSIAHVNVVGSNRLEFVFPKGPDVCVSVPSVVYGTAAVPKVVPC
jgi:hypothetical protein